MITSIIFVEEFKAELKKAIDDHSCKEPLEVGFRRGAEWALLESNFPTAKLHKQFIEILEENAELRASLQRQVQP